VEGCDRRRWSRFTGQSACICESTDPFARFPGSAVACSRKSAAAVVFLRHCVEPLFRSKLCFSMRKPSILNRVNAAMRPQSRFPRCYLNALSSVTLANRALNRTCRIGKIAGAPPVELSPALLGDSKTVRLSTRCNGGADIVAVSSGNWFRVRWIRGRGSELVQSFQNGFQTLSHNNTDDWPRARFLCTPFGNLLPSSNPYHSSIDLGDPHWNSYELSVHHHHLVDRRTVFNRLIARQNRLVGSRPA